MSYAVPRQLGSISILRDHIEPGNTPSLVAALATVHACCPAFQEERLVAMTGKSALIAGRLADVPAIAKVLLDQGPSWKARFAHEARFYWTVKRQDVPVRIPRLLWSDVERGVLVLEFLDGYPLAGQRYPAHAVDPDGFARVLRALPSIHAWRPWARPHRKSVIAAAQSRLSKHVARGLISAEHAAHIGTMLRTSAWEPNFVHGDLLFSNCLMDHRDLAILDWEYARYDVPGYDEALLWTLLMDDEAKRQAVLDPIRERGGPVLALFLINLVIVMAREIHMLRETDIAVHHDRAAVLEGELANVCRRLETCFRQVATY